MEAFDKALSWLPALLQGAWVTMQITAGAFVVGLVLGVLTAWCKLRGAGPLSWAANLYTTVYRAVPELLMILLLYYAGTDLMNYLFALFGLEEVEINGFAAAIVVLGVVQGAYVAEIIRGAVLAVPFGQIEAATALGMRPWLRNWRVVFPAMLPVALGGLANLWLILIKDSALISVVGYNELLYTAKQAAGSTRNYMLFYSMVAVIYLLMTLVSNQFIALLERRFQRWMPAQQ